MQTYGDLDFRHRRRHSMIEQIRTLNPDVVCLHELNPVPSEAAFIAKALDMDVFWHIHLAGIRLGPIGMPWNLYEGDAIFARKSLGLKALGRRKLSGGLVTRYASFNTQDATQILAAQIQCEDRVVPIFTTHWHAGVTPGPDIEDRARRIQKEEAVEPAKIQKALEMMRGNAGIRLKEAAWTVDFVDRTLERTQAENTFAVLSGDFNANPGTPEIRHLLDHGFADAYSAKHDDLGPTWDYAQNDHHKTFYSDYDPDLYLRLNYTRLKIPHRLDYIFYRPSPGATLLRCEIAMKDRIAGVQASDHFGVLAEFQID